jgi:hypothetical protein
MGGKEEDGGSSYGEKRKKMRVNRRVTDGRGKMVIFGS